MSGNPEGDDYSKVSIPDDLVEGLKTMRDLATQDMEGEIPIRTGVHTAVQGAQREVFSRIDELPDVVENLPPNVVDDGNS